LERKTVIFKIELNRTKKGGSLMGKKNRRKKDWHHRVPDFKLVYCGTKKHRKEELEKLSQRMIETSSQIVS